MKFDCHHHVRMSLECEMSMALNRSKLRHNRGRKIAVWIERQKSHAEIASSISILTTSSFNKGYCSQI